MTTQQLITPFNTSPSLVKPFTCTKKIFFIRNHWIISITSRLINECNPRWQFKGFVLDIEAPVKNIQNFFQYLSVLIDRRVNVWHFFHCRQLWPWLSIADQMQWTCSSRNTTLECNRHFDLGKVECLEKNGP